MPARSRSISPTRSPTRGGSCTVMRRRFNALDCFAYMVRDQEVSHLVPFVPVGWGRRLQRIEGKSLILVLVVSIPTAPANISFTIQDLPWLTSRRMATSIARQTRDWPAGKRCAKRAQELRPSPHVAVSRRVSRRAASDAKLGSDEWFYALATSQLQPEGPLSCSSSTA